MPSKSRSSENGIDWQQYNQKVVAARLDPETTSLLEKEKNKSEFIREALRFTIDEDVFQACPTCKGKGHIYLGKSKSKQKAAKKRYKKKPGQAKKLFTIKVDEELYIQLKNVNNLSGLVREAVILSLAYQEEMTCPTCQGRRKILMP